MPEKCIAIIFVSHKKCYQGISLYHVVHTFIMKCSLNFKGKAVSQNHQGIRQPNAEEHSFQVC